MGKFKDKHGKTLVGVILEKIGKSVPSVLELAGDLTGIEALERAGSIISGESTLTPEDKELLLEELKIAKTLEIARLNDIDSARDMQNSALTQEDKFSKRFVYYIASFWSFVAAMFIFGVMFIDVPPNNIRLIDTILGFLLGTIVASIITYFFGSSQGSAKKNDVIERLKGLINSPRS